jgi:hypothetical protein
LNQKKLIKWTNRRTLLDIQSQRIRMNCKIHWRTQYCSNVWIWIIILRLQEKHLSQRLVQHYSISINHLLAFRLLQQILIIFFLSLHSGVKQLLLNIKCCTNLLIRIILLLSLIQQLWEYGEDHVLREITHIECARIIDLQFRFHQILLIPC